MFQNTLDVPREDEWEAIYRKITPTLAETLSLVRDGFRMRAIARMRGVSLNTVRTQVGQLEAMTECHNLDALANWWREHDRRWLRTLALRAGISPDP